MHGKIVVTVVAIGSILIFRRLLRGSPELTRPPSPEMKSALFRMKVGAAAGLFAALALFGLYLRLKGVAPGTAGPSSGVPPYLGALPAAGSGIALGALAGLIGGRRASARGHGQDPKSG